MSQRQKMPIYIITYNIRYYHTSISDISRHFLSSSRFNFSSKFNVIICNFFQFRSSSWLEIQTQLDIRFTQGQIGTVYLIIIKLENQFRSKFNVIICNFFQFRSSNCNESQNQLDIRFTQGQIGTEYLFLIQLEIQFRLEIQCHYL